MASESNNNALVFVSPSCTVDPSFWEELYHRKINLYKLDDSTQHIDAVLSSNGMYQLNQRSFVNKEEEEKEERGNRDGMGVRLTGDLLNFNLLSGFKDLDKRKYLQSEASNLLYRITTNDEDNPELQRVLRNPSLLLNAFTLIVFADLKAYNFTYWFAVPTLIPESPFRLTQSPCLLVDFMSSSLSLESTSRSPHASSLIRALYQIFTSEEGRRENLISQGVFGLLRNTSESSSIDNEWKAVSLLDCWQRRNDIFNCHIVLVDPMIVASGTISDDSNLSRHSWRMRNLLALLSLHANDSSEPKFVNMIAFRGNIVRYAINSGSRSRAFDYVSKLSGKAIEDQDESVIMTIDIRGAFPSVCSPSWRVAVPNILQRAVGWSVNDKGRPGPRTAVLSALLDDNRLAAQAMDLNLRLMKWRLWPELDTEVVANTKCLLLGAGTLGCAVARSLLSWGVRTITMVDNGQVSYSNPGRQCLFELSDCKDKRFKADAACAALKRIFPDINATSVILTIPMPGHPFSTFAGANDQSSTPQCPEEQAVQRLDELIQSHDVVFALTDSREARWLPTVMCAAYDKILINAALGFDTYLVMRHGHGIDAVSPATSVLSSSAAVNESERLGCYFCTDVVAAINSQKDRTLDQQCTVTRPGLSFIASAMAVEMMVALLQSPLRHRHPSDLVIHNRKLQRARAALAASASSVDEAVRSQSHLEEAEDDLPDLIPHQLRGSVRNFSHYNPATPAFDCCTACSIPVVNQYRAHGTAFVRAACDDIHGKYLEEVSGITALTSAIDLDLVDACEFEDF